MKFSAEGGADRKVRRVTLFSSTLNQAGGGERLLLELARGMEMEGIDVTIVVLDYHPRALFGGRFAPTRLIALGRPPRGLRYICRWMTTLLKTRQTIVAAGTQHIVVQSETNAVFVCLAMLGRNIPYSIQIFGQMFQFPDDLTKYARVFRKHLPTIIGSMEGYRQTIPMEMPRAQFFSKVLNEVAACARYIVVREAHSRFVLSRQVAWEISLLYRRPSTILRGAFSEEIFETPPLARQHGTLLSLSRLVPKKNVHLTVEAFSLIARGEPTYKLLIGGTGPERARLEELVQTLGIAGQVIFIGYIPEADLRKVYQSCSAFVMLDVADYNITLYEALALGTPVIVSRDQEIDAGIGDSELLYRTNLSADAIALQMRRVLSRDEVPNLDSSHREHLRGMTWENYARAFADEINDAR